MLEPVKPLTTVTPSFCAARAVFFISSAARALTPAGLPSPQTVRRQDGLVPRVDHVQHGLADEVIADRPDLKPVALQQFAFPLAVFRLGHGQIDLEVIAPAGQFEAIVTETLELLGQLLQGQVGPLAREHGDRSWHEKLLELNCDSGYRRTLYFDRSRGNVQPGASVQDGPNGRVGQHGLKETRREMVLCPILRNTHTVVPSPAARTYRHIAGPPCWAT